MENITRVIGAVIFDPETESFFVGQRSKLKKYPLKWEFIGDKVKIPTEFEDFAWVDSKEIKKYDCILRIPKEIEKTIKIYNN